MTDHTIECPSHLNITMVESFKESLQAPLDGGGACTLDLSKIEKVDSTGLQLLLLFTQAMTKQGGSVQYIGASETFTNTANVLGLTDQFQVN